MPLPLTLAQLAQQYEQQGLQMYQQEPDISGLQEYARQRTQEGNSAALNAMAAQYAGKGFEPMQAQFLKQSMAAQEPLKVGNAGYITPKGQYVKDPTFQNDRRAEVLLKQAQSLYGLDDRQTQAQANRDSREMIAGMRSGQNSGANDARMWRGEDTLRSSFDTITKDLRESFDATSKIGTIITPYVGRSLTDIPAIQQQSLVILLNKFLDPGSVVREGEFDRVVQAQGLIGRASNLLDYLAQGKPLNAESIKQIGDLANLYSQAASKKYSTYATQYGEVAKRRGFDVNNVILTPTLGGGSVGGPSSSDPLGLLGGQR